MEQSSIRVRHAFSEAAGFLVDLVDSIGAEEWDRPALGDWNVAELVVHASRAASTVVAYADTPAELTMDGAAEYYVEVLGTVGVHEAVSERARSQAADIDGPLGEYLTAAVAEAEQMLSRTPANQVLGTLAGGIRLVDYLPSRVVELVVHGIDLADALGRPVDVPPVAMEVTLETMADLAVARPDVVDPAQILRALTGRGELPPGANLLG